MRKEIIVRLARSFEESGFVHEGIEVWMARDLQALLGYSKWDNFLTVVDRAKIACASSGQEIDDHFADVGKMVPVGSGAEREIPDIILTRYACYLIAQNGDPRKEAIAFAQSYFALQTRKQELLEERIELSERLAAREKLTETEKDLSRLIYHRGVDDRGFAIIRSKGDTALFGGFSTLDMKQRLGVPKARALADFLPTVTIKAKDLATEMTNHTVRHTTIFGESSISAEHVKNNRNVRGALAQSGILPENLPLEDDIRKLERRVKSDERRLLRATKTLPKA